MDAEATATGLVSLQSALIGCVNGTAALVLRLYIQYRAVPAWVHWSCTRPSPEAVLGVSSTHASAALDDVLNEGESDALTDGVVNEMRGTGGE